MEDQKKQIPFLKQGILIFILLAIFFAIKFGGPIYIQSKSIEILEDYISQDGETTYYSTPIMEGEKIVGEDILAKKNAIIIRNNLHNFKVQITDLTKKKIELTLTDEKDEVKVFSISQKEKEPFVIPYTNGYSVQLNDFISSKEVVYLQIKYAEDSIEDFE